MENVVTDRITRSMSQQEVIESDSSMANIHSSSLDVVPSSLRNEPITVERESSTPKILQEYEVRITAMEEKIALLESRDQTREKSLSVMEGRIATLETTNANLLRMTDDNEQYSRKQNIILDGLHIKKNDTDNPIRNMIIAEIKRLS